MEQITGVAEGAHSRKVFLLFFFLPNLERKAKGKEVLRKSVPLHIGISHMSGINVSKSAEKLCFLLVLFFMCMCA